MKSQTAFQKFKEGERQSQYYQVKDLAVKGAGDSSPSDCSVLLRNPSASSKFNSFHLRKKQFSLRNAWIKWRLISFIILGKANMKASTRCCLNISFRFCKKQLTTNDQEGDLTSQPCHRLLDKRMDPTRFCVLGSQSPGPGYWSSNLTENIPVGSLMAHS